MPAMAASGTPSISSRQGPPPILKSGPFERRALGSAQTFGNCDLEPAFADRRRAFGVGGMRHGTARAGGSAAGDDIAEHLATSRSGNCHGVAIGHRADQNLRPRRHGLLAHPGLSIDRRELHSLVQQLLDPGMAVDESQLVHHQRQGRTGHLGKTPGCLSAGAISGEGAGTGGG
ncbi:hypothetical protein D3C87_1501080 [compost metagenome]